MTKAKDLIDGIIGVVTDNIVNKYVDTGKVPDWVVIKIATKIKRGKKLNNNEQVIFYGKTAEINEAIVKLR
jgi:hypothetical protein